MAQSYDIMFPLDTADEFARSAASLPPLDPGCDYALVTDQSASAIRKLNAQRQRRSQIFATLRRMMAMPAFEQKRVQDIADECGVAIQTLYNLAGNRFDMVSRAIEQWGKASFLISRASAQACGEDPILHALETFWRSGIEHPQYVRSVSDLTLGSNRMEEYLWHRTGVELQKDLSVLASQGGLRDWIDVRGLALQLARSANTTILHWDGRQDGTPALWRELLNGPGVMLTGALTGTSLARAERTLNAICVRNRLS